MQWLIKFGNAIVLMMMCLCINVSSVSSQNKNATTKQVYTAYLFAYFTGNTKSEEAIRFALSNDGYHFRALNNNQPIILSEKISSTGGVRDPHILRGNDGKTFYMVATDMVSANGWNSNRAMVLLKSTNLIDWAFSIINIPQRFAGNDSLQRVWAPQTIYDNATGKYMIYWSMKHGKDIDKIYYAYANADFTDLETAPNQLFYSPTNGSCIDGDIIFKDGKYHLFFKTEGDGAGIKVAISNKLTEGYVLQDKYLQQTKDPVEGAGVFKLNNSEDYILMYDVYTKGKYQFTRTKDFVNFKAIDEDVTMNFHPRHGTIMPITYDECKALVSKWGSSLDVVSPAYEPSIKQLNKRIDTTNKTLYLQLQPNTNLNKFNPRFVTFAGSKIEPVTANKKAKGILNYKVSINGKQPEFWKIIATETHNPVLDGYYADPDILYSEKTKKFYIYPTSDGFTNWSGTYFKTFSSPNLVNWKDEGVVLDLNKDVSWAKKNAWAPCILEKRTGDNYKYYFYFTAAQKIGVAVADNPTGPFVDNGKPIIDKYPEGIKKGQQIDPDVFTDPKTGKSYLYWGNSYMACAELNDDMVSIKQETLKILTPDAGFREGTTVFYRHGTYYFLWSEDDTRSENYRVRYGTSDTPNGKIIVAENNLVIAKDAANGIYATGHNSVVQIPGKDEWYIVYHRFNYPAGIAMGRAAGYNREVCIDKLEFNIDGTIKQVTPTLAGIAAIKL